MCPAAIPPKKSPPAGLRLPWPNEPDGLIEEAIQKYNSKFSPKTASDPDDSYNKKYLPTFYKKDAWLDNAKSDEQFQKDLITKPWKKEKYFNY